MRKKLIICLILAVFAILAPVNAAEFAIQPFDDASDAGIVPITAENSDINSCEDLGLSLSAYCIDESANPIGGCSNPDGFSAVYDATDLYDISWSSNYPVDAIVVKDGALEGNAYVYDPNDRTSDSGLWTPLPANGAGGISHVFFCYSTPTQTPEFPVVALPVGMIIGLVGVVLVLKKTKET
jgi:hypothetical protein